MELNNEFEVAVPIEEAWAVLTDVERIAPCLPGAELREVEGDEYRGVVKVKVGPITASYKGSARFEELDASGHRAVLKAEGRETRGQGNASATITATLTPSGSGTRVEVATDLAISGKVAQFGRGVLGDVSAKLLDQFVRNLEQTVLAPKSAAGDAPASAAGGGSAGGGRGAAGKGDAGAGAGSEADDVGAAGSGAESGSGSKPAVTRAARKVPSAAKASSNADSAKAGDDDEVPAAAPAVASGPRRIDGPPAEPVDLMDVAGGSLARRLAPYMTVAGILLIVRIVVYSLRRRRRT